FGSAREMAEALERATGAAGSLQSGMFTSPTTEPTPAPTNASRTRQSSDIVSGAAQTRTLHGTSTTRARTPGRRTPALVIATTPLALGIAVLLLLRARSGETSRSALGSEGTAAPQIVPLTLPPIISREPDAALTLASAHAEVPPSTMVLEPSSP